MMDAEEAAARTSSPLLEALVARLRAQVAQLAAGAKLPPVRQLTAQLGVSQHLLQRAMEQLRAEGLVSSHVGRGTFAGPAVPAGSTTRRVLTLLYEHPYQRGDVMARSIHQQLAIDGHDSLTLTYSNVPHVMELLQGGARYDSCILQPRSSMIPIALLGLLKQRADHLLIEGYAAEHLDVDSVSNDPGTCVALIADHVFGLGHRRVGWITEDTGNYFFERTAQLFRLYCRGAGLSEADCPVVRAATDPDRLGVRDLAGELGRLKDGRGRLPVTALVIASFVDGKGILDAFAKQGLAIPDDVAVVRIGSPDLTSDHEGRITVVGRPSLRAARTVLDRVYWRWQHPGAPFGTHYDQPEIAIF